LKEDCFWKTGYQTNAEKLKKFEHVQFLLKGDQLDVLKINKDEKTKQTWKTDY
jgi:hypothetical protein